MKVALVICPNPPLRVPTAHFPQGILYVGGALRRAGHEVQIADLRAKDAVRAEDIPEADVVGVTATSGEAHFARQVSKIARARGVLTMIGGAHATFMPEDCTRDFDLVIKGDGEEAAEEALWAPGVFEHRLDNLAGYFPDWQLIGEQGLSRELLPGAGYGEGPLAAGCITSRGCPHWCSYCRSERDRVRFRPVFDVAVEILELDIRYGVKHLRLYDENITLNRKRALELFDALARLGTCWRGHTRSDTWDDELAEAARKGGCEEMGFGFEAASGHVLERVRKQETVEQHREAARVCKRHGILCKAFWMVGLPLQGWREIEDIKRFMAEERPEKWIVSCFAPYPGCDIRARPDEYGVSWMDPGLSHYWNFARDGATIGYHDNPKEEIEAQFQELETWLEKSFPRG